MTAHRFEGGCHCGNLGFVFEASAGLETLGLRADQCSFCRAHNARTTSDPNGSISVSASDPGKLVRYRFGLKLADFIICARCGVYIGAVMQDGGLGWMTVNVNAFRPPPDADLPVTPVDFDAEDTAARLARRKRRWTPVKELRI